jgi:hypothetical protein
MKKDTIMASKQAPKMLIYDDFTAEPQDGGSNISTRLEKKSCVMTIFGNVLTIFYDWLIIFFHCKK